MLPQCSRAPQDIQAGPAIGYVLKPDGDSEREFPGFFRGGDSREIHFGLPLMTIP